MTLQRWLGVLLYVAIALNAIASFGLEKKRRALMPGTRPYAWGIFVGLTSIFWGALIFVGVTVMALAQQSSHMVSIVLTAAVVGWVYTWAGYYTIQRQRTAFVIATLISANPVWWIANTIYGRKRWNELTSRRARSLRDEHPRG